ncbi:hypothetical protein MIMGU_mgv1a008581mg [Erythranthe guttata]|uniref:NAD-dependent epimerase/dehydratase domain-containing protein n=1 Tax=Erythranthe guttata TaxID=4155 RepID=A0A022QW26_ERYGU|nr:hypothetical protein MIMGU_mgv1a008581mg [Erythranthe guttata]
MGEAGPPLGHAAPSQRVLRPGHRRRRLRRLTLLPRPEETRRRSSRAGQLQLVLRPGAEEIPAGSSHQAPNLHRGGRLNDAVLLNKLFDIVPFSHILQVEAQAGVRYAMQNPLSYINSNIAGFVNLLEVAKAADPQPAIVWASSSSVYGLNTEVPFSENHRTDQPASLYAATKKAGEEIAHTYNHIYGLSLTGLRFFTVYGPWGRPDMAYFFFTKDILHGKGINVYVTQDEKEVARDFTYIDDIVKGCVGALEHGGEEHRKRREEARPGAAPGLQPWGTPPPSPSESLVGILETLLGTKAKKRVVKMPRNGDVPYTHANVSLAYKDFGYKPTTDLATGLRKFVKWYVSYYGIESRVKKENEPNTNDHTDD